ncbi:hypothetical protein SEUCBS139899_010816 [Sporothrix eucalyptigena]
MSLTAIVPATVSLSANDARVFQALFDAETSYTRQPAVVVEAAKPALAGFTDKETDRLTLEIRHALRPVTSVANPPQECIESAFRAISDFVQREPLFSPAYLDRAQAARLLVADEAELFKFGDSGGGRPEVLDSIVSDLLFAIQLASAPPSGEPVSHFTAQLLAKAHTHLAYLLLMLSQSSDLSAKHPVLRHLAVETPTQEALEDMASKHFQLGGLYGNDMARDMAVHINPYAKMCGAIVQEVMKREISGEEGADK